MGGDTDGYGDAFAADTASLLALFRYWAFVNQTSRDLLERDAKPAGLDNWSAYVNQGGRRLELARILAYSQEYRRLLVHDRYARRLRRRADTGGLAAWVRFPNA